MRRRALLLLVLSGLSAPLSVRLAAQTGRNCEVLSQLARPGATGYAAVDGYVDPASGREFALVCTYEGYWIVETSNPRAPVEKAFFPGGLVCPWRDMTTWHEYVYASSDYLPGIYIFSMANPDAPALVQLFTLPGWTGTHYIGTDVTTGTLYCNGTSQVGMMLFDVAGDPAHPRLIRNVTEIYVHDSFAQHGFAYLASIFTGQFLIFDVTQLPAMNLLGFAATPGGFTHSAWPNSTDTLLLTCDEFHGGGVQFWDITNKSQPLALGAYATSGARSVHKAELRDDKVAHMAYYEAGYRAVEITDPSHPREIAAYPLPTTWGMYPHQPSRSIYATGMDPGTGLYILRLTCGVPEPYGRGTAGSANVIPTIDWHGSTAHVDAPAFRIEGRSMQGLTPAFLILGVGPASLPGAGVELLVDPTLPLFILPVLTGGAGPGSGSAAMSVPIPNDPSYGGLTLYAQWLVADPGGPQGLAASAGLRVTICP